MVQSFQEWAFRTGGLRELHRLLAFVLVAFIAPLIGGQAEAVVLGDMQQARPLGESGVAALPEVPGEPLGTEAQPLMGGDSSGSRFSGHVQTEGVRGEQGSLLWIPRSFFAKLALLVVFWLR